MLLRLALEEFVLFAAAAMEFGPGLNVLTGETGAGKSILIDALGLLAGGRGSADWIRTGADRLSVEGVFDLGSSPLRRQLEEAGIRFDESHTLVLRRELGRDGRSRAFANGRSVLVADLKSWSHALLRLVCQGDVRELESSSALESLLDGEAGSASLAVRYSEHRAAHLAAQARLEELARVGNDAGSEEEWLRFQRDEIQAAAISAGERERVAESLRAARANLDAASLQEEIRARLIRDEGSVLDHLETLAHRLRGAHAEALSEIEREVLALRDSVRSLRHRLEAEGPEPLDPAELEERLRLLDRLRKKYGGDEESVLAHLSKVEERIELLASLESERELATLAAQDAWTKVSQVGEELSRARQRAAKELAAAADRVLADLAMKGASLAFDFARGEPQAGGLDRVSLRFRSHPSEAWGNLARVASGGELSRVLLSLESTATGRSLRPNVWVFDEIDAGIGGETAKKVAEHLATLAQGAQVLLVTHLPVIAARADRQLRVRKLERAGRPHGEVSPVEREERLGELARMLSGDEGSAIARRHAQDLLAASKTVSRAGKTR